MQLFQNNKLLLYFQTRNLKKLYTPNSVGCGDTSVFKQSPVNLPAMYIDLNNGYDDIDFQKLELDTRLQSNYKD